MCCLSPLRLQMLGNRPFLRCQALINGAKCSLSSPLPHFRFQWDDYTVKVHINDYLDIVCPHYPLGVPPSQEAERYVLYMVEQRDYNACRPQSYEQLRWECAHPFAPHAPERFSEKFQRYTPFTLGKEFRQGESYYYISKPLHLHGSNCLRLRVDVVGPTGSQESRPGGGGVHNSSNRLPADEPIVLPEVQRSVAAGSRVATVAVSSFLTSMSVLLLLLLR
uniref:Ephrin-A1 n=1 Tax=Paramormyrops kingsleyae TaxID=1676925 RepID=A0A3B3RBK7_9TELE